MSTSSQNPKPDNPGSARKAIADLLWLSVPSADNADAKTRAGGMLNAYRAEVERKVRAEIAADFVRQGKASNSLTWGQAHEIALNGLCACSGGVKPCDMGGAA